MARDRLSVAMHGRDPGEGAAEWASTRTMRALLIRPACDGGWTQNEYDELIEYARERHDRRSTDR